MIPPVVRDQWFPIAALAELGRARTTLLETPIDIIEGGVRTADGAARPVRRHLGYLWTTLGEPEREIFSLPEHDEPDRRTLHAGAFRVRTSGPRLVENFLDMGHFSFVHTGYLGVEPHTEIQPYKVAFDPALGELLATECRTYQPLASLAAETGLDVSYTYRVPHPFCAVLYKTSPLAPRRRDVIGLFCQPVSETVSIAYAYVAMLDDTHSDAEIKAWQQVIFGQDRPILENQRPARLPLARGAELSIPADAASAAYRRWLLETGMLYGATA